MAHAKASHLQHTTSHAREYSNLVGVSRRVTHSRRGKLRSVEPLRACHGLIFSAQLCGLPC